MNKGGLRVVAVAAAATMVVGAVAVRSLLDDDDDPGGGGTGGPLTLACPPDLARACEEADLDDITVVIEDAAATADAVSGTDNAGGLDADLWLAPRPWVEAAEARRAGDRLDPLVEDTMVPEAPVASSSVVLVIWDEQAAVLEAGPCPDTITWRCVGDAAEERWEDLGGPGSWGRVRAGITDPAGGSGLVVLGALVTDQVGAADFHPNDLDPDVERWLDRFAASADNAGPPEAVDTMLTRGQGHLAALGTTEAAATRAEGRDDLRIETPEPALAVDLVVAPLNDDARDAAQDLDDDSALADALAADGWRRTDDPDAPATDAPPPGPVLHAVLETWRSL